MTGVTNLATIAASNINDIANAAAT